MSPDGLIPEGQPAAAEGDRLGVELPHCRDPCLDVEEASPGGGQQLDEDSPGLALRHLCAVANLDEITTLASELRKTSRKSEASAMPEEQVRRSMTQSGGAER